MKTASIRSAWTTAARSSRSSIAHERLTDAAILEEHTFLAELADAELPCVAPLRTESGETLLQHDGYRFTLFPRQGGHAPNLESEENLRVLGRTMARIHRVGRSGRFKHRPKFTVERLGVESKEFVLQHDFVPDELIDAYTSVTTHLLDANRSDSAAGRWAHSRRLPSRQRAVARRCAAFRRLRRHRDGTGGAGSVDAAFGRTRRTNAFARKTARRLRDVSRSSTLRELALIESLRTLRIMHHAAWIARRWNDPAFQRGFPAFGGMRYWSEHVLHLREQLAALDEPPLAP